MAGGFDQVGKAVDGYIALFKIMMVASVIMLPLAIWKLVDIAIWLFGHVTIQWN